MVAVINSSMVRVVTAAANIVPRDPAMPAVAVVPWDPDPVIPLVPVAPAMIIRPITDRDFEADCLRLLHHRRRYGRNCRQKDQKFLFHTLFDHLPRNLFGHNGLFFGTHPRRRDDVSPPDARLTVQPSGIPGNRIVTFPISQKRCWLRFLFPHEASNHWRRDVFHRGFA
jgi:hypothetical protein